MVNPALRTPSFRDLEVLGRPFSDRALSFFMNEALGALDPEAAIQRWFTMARPTPEEIELMNDPQAIASLHAQTAQMIARNSKIKFDLGRMGSVGPGVETYLNSLNNAYKKELEADDGSKLVAALDAWRRTGQGGSVKLGDAVAYPRYQPVYSKEGERIDLSNRFGKKPDGVRASISYQEGLGDAFIHWATDALLDHQIKAGSPKFARRMYLNPKMQDQPMIFEKIMTELNKAGLIVAGKMVDRAKELAMASATRPKVGEEPDVRTDGILLGMLDHEADTVLGVVEEIYREHYDSFKGRAVPKVAQRIGEGVAVSDESPNPGKESMTTHRAAALRAAAVATRAELGLKPGQSFDSEDPRGRNLFEEKWYHHARAAGINPKNLTWNLKQIK